MKMRFPLCLLSCVAAFASCSPEEPKAENLSSPSDLSSPGKSSIPKSTTRNTNSNAAKRMDLSKIHGKIQIVTSFPDYKVQVVDSFADLHVKKVTSFPDDPGEWQIVDSFPDFKIQIVTSFPDFKIKYVDSFPGVQ